MGKESDILFDLVKIWADQNELYSKQGAIKSVNESQRICVVTPNDGGPDIEDVRLEADFTDGQSTNPKGFFIVPSAGSNVIVTFMSKEYGFLSAWTSIDKVVAKQGEWIFNDGANLGLVKVTELTNKFLNIDVEYPWSCRGYFCYLILKLIDLFPFNLIGYCSISL